MSPLAKAGPSTHVLVELISDLPGGYRDIQTIKSKLTAYKAEVWEELTRKAPDQKGRWKYSYLRIIVWVPRETYRPFSTSLGMMQKNGKLRLNPSTYL